MTRGRGAIPARALLSPIIRRLYSGTSGGSGTAHNVPSTQAAPKVIIMLWTATGAEIRLGEE